MSEVLALPSTFEAAVITLGAMSGALHAVRRDMDLTGILTVATVTGLGGGLIRDVLLQNGIPVLLAGGGYLAMALFAAAVGFVFATAIRAAEPAIDVVDTALIGMWVSLGAQRALLVDLPWPSVVLLGFITAVGGGMLRDVLCRDVPSIFRPGAFFALAALAGGFTYVAVEAVTPAGAGVVPPTLAAVGVAAALRVLSQMRQWHSPMPYDVSDRVLAPLRAARDRLRDATSRG